MASNGPRRVTACHSRDQNWPALLHGTFTVILDSVVVTRFKNQVICYFIHNLFDGSLNRSLSYNIHRSFLFKLYYVLYLSKMNH